MADASIEPDELVVALVAAVAVSLVDFAAVSVDDASETVTEVPAPAASFGGGGGPCGPVEVGGGGGGG
jgi:uncharacterized membrane protein